MDAKHHWEHVDADRSLQLIEQAWLPPGGYAAANAWALENRQALEHYAAEIEHHGTAAEELRQYLQDADADAA